MRTNHNMALLALLIGCAATEPKPNESWVAQTLSTLSVEEKVGQVMVPPFPARFFNQNDEYFKWLLKLVREYHVGGVMFYRGQPYEVARNIERLQQAAEIPLLVMADMEWGLAMRVDESTRFPQNMAIGATGNESYAYEIGKITAQEARAAGVHVAFAPVMDVNNNPHNIIINTRSYGEDPQLAARLGSAFIRGLQENGVYATAKHFPGHGDTETDSHIALPTIDAPLSRLQEVELPPFRAAVEAGVKLVMTAHITFSAAPEMQGRPATLDSYFIQNILRKEMGFTGLVISDAMEMGGIAENYWSGEAAVMAINAGVDILLVPPNFESTFAFVTAAVKDGRIPMTRLDEAVRRILQAKFDLGLQQRPRLDLQLLEQTLGHPAHRAAAEKIANAAVTLLRNEKNALPLAAEKVDSALVVTVTDEIETSARGAPLNREVMQRVPTVFTAFIDPRSTDAELQKILAKADSVDAVIVGLHVTWRNDKGTIALPDTTAKLLGDLFAVDKPMAVISFGSPYVLQQIPQAPSYLCVYDSSPLAARAAARAVFGEIPVSGKLPVTIPGWYHPGDGIQRPARRMELVKAINDSMFHEAYAVLEKAIADSIFPGAQIAIVRDGQLLASRGFGRQTYDPNSPPVTTETIYDLASVTKVAATTLAAMSLWEQKKILLDIPIKSYVPEFSSGRSDTPPVRAGDPLRGKDSVTLRHLLTHSAGVHWWVDLWNKVSRPDSVIDYICQLPLDYHPGDSMIYSDLGIILAGKILETVTGQKLNDWVASQFYQPLGMTNTMFNPPPALRSRIAPTEIGGSMNRGLIHGEVHDENAFFLGGISAHAGLFSTAEDLAALAQMLINGGIYRHRRFMSPAAVTYWTSRQRVPEWSTRALGWDTPADSASAAGDYFSPGSFGHTGFTGTSIWVDPTRKIAVILLTNRVHPTRQRGGIYPVRREFHNAVMGAILKKHFSD